MAGLLMAAGVAAAPALAQQQTPGPALAPLTRPLDALSRADGSQPIVRPRVAAAARLTDATPAGEIGPGTEATVLADAVSLTGDRRLEASGGVVVWYQGTRLVAPRVVYDGAADRLLIEGPIQLSRPGDRGTPDDAVLVADAAELDGELRAGILRGARLVLARQLQLAAREVRVNDAGDSRITVLDRVAASACHVCAGNPTPLWEIRARRVTHDSATRRLAFERPQFRAFGLPVAAMPFTVTAPDPTVERMTGFLRPELRTTSKLGFGIKVPWFRTLGDSADLTLTPYLSVERTVTLNARYRQAFASGALVWEGAISRDDIEDGTRGYSFGAATVALPADFTMAAQLQWASDRDYLDDYGISDADRLWSGVRLTRVRRDQLIALDAGAYRTLRDDEVEIEDRLPTQVAEGLWIQRVTPPASVGGLATLTWGLHGHRRPSDADDVGRDVARASLTADWQRGAVLPGGVLGQVQARLDADAWRYGDDSTRTGTITRATPTLGAQLRWPLVRQSAGGSDVLEPVLAFAASPRRENDDDDVVNEDSLFPELDEGNLTALDRLPGRDATETGLRAAAGLGWTRITPSGTSLGLTAGRLWYAHEDEGGVPQDSVLGRSDWLFAATFQQPSGLAAVGRALVGDDDGLTSAEARLGWLRPDLQLSAGYAYQAGFGDEDRLSQLGFDAGVQVRQGWWARATGRYNLAEDHAQDAALGVTWRNECITVEAQLERSWDEDESESETGFDFAVRLGGFGRQSDAGPVAVAPRRCMR